MQLCFKPERLSGIPLNLLFVLTKKKLLPQTRLAATYPSAWFVFECSSIDFRQFNLKHLSSIQSEKWDWMDCHNMRELCLVLCDTIKEVIFYSDGFPMLPGARCPVSEMFPKSSKWQFVFQGTSSPHSGVVKGFLRESQPATLKEMIFTSNNAPPVAECDSKIDCGYGSVFANVRKLRVLRIPQFDLNDIAALLWYWEVRSSDMLHFEDRCCSLVRDRVDQPFTVLDK